MAKMTEYEKNKKKELRAFKKYLYRYQTLPYDYCKDFLLAFCKGYEDGAVIRFKECNDGFEFTAVDGSLEHNKTTKIISTKEYDQWFLFFS